MPLVDSDARNPARYTFDTAGGAVRATRFGSYEVATQHTAGPGVWRRVGLLRNRRKVFVALYTNEALLRL